jgi:hypothetical protein
VTEKQWLMPYPEMRAIEDVTYMRRAVPDRILSILLPVWRVTVRANITEGEPYALIDRYLEKAIATADLNTAAELAGFFGLDPVVVARALQFLTAIGHVANRDGHVVLTELGRRSVRDGQRYVVKNEDRRVLYFDAFGSRPLPSACYDSAVVTLLTADEAASWRNFQMLFSVHGFRTEALAELVSAPRSQQTRFNLPAGIDELESLGTAECVFLPMYLVRAVQDGTRLRLFCYLQTRGEADPDLTDLCERTPDITGVVEAEHAVRTPTFPEKVERWQRDQGLSEYLPRRLDDGTWQIDLPAACFGDSPALPWHMLGSFVVRDGGVLRLWCEDLHARHRALLARIDDRLGRQAKPDSVSTEELAALIARQLALQPVDLLTLRHMAAEAGNTALAAQLDQL